MALPERQLKPQGRRLQKSCMLSAIKYGGTGAYTRRIDKIGHRHITIKEKGPVLQQLHNVYTPKPC